MSAELPVLLVGSCSCLQLSPVQIRMAGILGSAESAELLASAQVCARTEKGVPHFRFTSDYFRWSGSGGFWNSLIISLVLVLLPVFPSRNCWLAVKMLHAVVLAARQKWQPIPTAANTVPWQVENDWMAGRDIHILSPPAFAGRIPATILSVDGFYGQLILKLFDNQT